MIDSLSIAVRAFVSCVSMFFSVDETLLPTQECCEQYGISPGGNTPQGINYTATCLLLRKLSKLDEPDMQDNAGEAGTSS